MKEYGIYIRKGNACPYMIHFYNNITEAKLKLFDMVQLQIDKQMPFFIDNDFYENNYSLAVSNLTYYCIKEREVSDWNNFSENESKNINKVVFLNNFRKIN